jgi:hypothetical protein
MAEAVAEADRITDSPFTKIIAGFSSRSEMQEAGRTPERGLKPAIILVDKSPVRCDRQSAAGSRN